MGFYYQLPLCPHIYVSVSPHVWSDSGEEKSDLSEKHSGQHRRWILCIPGARDEQDEGTKLSIITSRVADLYGDS